MTTIAFLGPEGTFAHAAVRTLAVADGATLLPQANVTLAIDAVRAGAADSAVVPLENSVEGAVPATLDELANGEPLIIAEEAYLLGHLRADGAAGHRAGRRRLRRHASARRGAGPPLADQASAHRPGRARRLRLRGAAQAVAGGEYDAAVGAAVAGELYGLSVLAHDIADNDGAVTRFVRLTRPGPPPPPTGNDRTSFVAYLRENHAGALLELLSELANRGINMTRIESRPDRRTTGFYCFSIDAEGHVADERVGDALAAPAPGVCRRALPRLLPAARRGAGRCPGRPGGRRVP